MTDPQKLAIFLGAAFLLAIAPGPGMLYVLSRSLAGGRREGALSAFGTFAGGMVHVVAAAAGVSIVLAKSALAFSVVKYAGAAYLGFLGIRMILESRGPRHARVSRVGLHSRSDSDSPLPLAMPQRRPFWQGMATEVLNPKTALFFLSFIPQFVDHRIGHPFLQFVALGFVSVILNTSADLVVIVLAGPLGERIRSSASFRRRQRAGTGAVMIGLGAYLAASDSH